MLNFGSQLRSRKKAQFAKGVLLRKPFCDQHSNIVPFPFGDRAARIIIIKEAPKSCAVFYFRVSFTRANDVSLPPYSLSISQFQVSVPLL